MSQLALSNSPTSVTDYLPGPEALLIRVDMSDYLLDYYLHRRHFNSNTTPEQDEKLKELIACFAIHLGARPPAEEHAWTMHLVASEPYSLFVTGSTGVLDRLGNGRGVIVGNVLTENIRLTDVHSLYAQFTGKDGASFKSYIRSDSGDISEMIEYFYRQSEQNPLRIHYSRTSDRAIGLAALPDCDLTWFESVDLEQLAASSDIPMKRMRNCHFDFRCECSPEKLLPFFRSLSDEALEELYGADKELVISCPRCGKHFTIDRAQVYPS